MSEKKPIMAKNSRIVQVLSFIGMVFTFNFLLIIIIIIIFAIRLSAVTTIYHFLDYCYTDVLIFQDR